MSRRNTFFIAQTFMNVYSYLFDGVNEAINFGNVLNFERTNTFSISAWFKTSAIATKTIIGKSFQISPFTGWELVTFNGSIRLILTGTTPGQGLIVTTTSIFNDGLWHNVIITYNGNSNASGIIIDVDNVNRAFTTNQNNLASSILNSLNLYIGSRNNSVAYWNGNIDEISVWDKVLSSGDKTAIYNLGAPTNLINHVSNANLLSWWRMGEGDTFSTNWTVNDSKGALTGTSIQMEVGDRITDVP